MSDQPPADRRRTLWLASLLIAGVTLLVYAPVRHYAFVTFDDGAYVVDNPHIATGLTGANIRWAFDNAYVGTGGPLTWVSHMLDVQWFGLDAGPHHVTSLTLHIINAVLLLWVLFAMTGAVWRSACVAALFAVHPAHVESVAWIAERKDVLSTFWWFVTMAAYVGYVRRPGAGRYALLFASLTAGLLAKPMLATLPAVLLLLDVWPLGRVDLSRDGWRRASALVVEKLPLAVPAIAAIALTFTAQLSLGAVSAAQPLSLRLENAALSAVKYLGVLVWPVNLAVFYPYPATIAMGVVAASVATIVLLTVLAVRARRRAPFVLTGWLWFLVTLVPVIGLVQVGGHAMADRFTYVPFIGLFIVASWGVAAAMPALSLPQRAGGAVGAAAVALLAIVAAHQVTFWQDSESLWSHAIAVTTDNDRAHANLGVTLALKGDLSGAIANYRESLRLNPNQAKTHNNLALLLTDPSQRAEAESHYREAIRLDPGYANAHNNLAILLGDARRFDESLSESREAIRLDDTNADAHMAFAVTLHDVGRVGESLAQVRAALQIKPNEARWHLMAGDLLMQQHQRTDAIAEAQLAYRLDPTLADAGQAASDWQAGK